MNTIQIINAKWWNAEAAYAYALARGLVKSGHGVTLIVLPDKAVAEKAKRDDIPTIETWALNRFNPLEVVSFFFTLLKIINKKEIDVINCHRSDGYPIVALAARLSGRKPALVRTRGDQRQVRKDLFNRFIYTRLTDAIITSGEVVKRGLVSRLGLNGSAAKVIYSAVDTGKFSPRPVDDSIRKEFGVSEEAPLIAILGRVSEVKGHRYLIDAAKSVLNDFPGARFLAIVKEEDPNFPILEKQVSELGMGDKFFFTGFREDLVDLMAACDIGVVSSIGSETNCRVALEWMAMGKPVIGTTIGVIPEVVVDGETGLIVPPKDHLAIASALLKLIKDRNLAIEMGKRGKKLVEDRYNEPLFTSDTLKVYTEALSKKNY
ncbi:MAG: glycosyltransferase family 4 protein [Proteobacteria bacterium]|nr:glycosyltransferase family 4 protein [Pseudomonadota bacterium]